MLSCTNGVRENKRNATKNSYTSPSHFERKTCVYISIRAIHNDNIYYAITIILSSAV